MDQFNRDTYKRETLFQEFYHSCLGKIIILAAIALVLFIIAVLTLPADEKMQKDTMANVEQCLQDNQDSPNDELDEFFANISRTFTETDSTLTNQEVLKAFKEYNTLEVFDHTAYKTVRLHNARNPQGVRIAIGIFGMVVSTVNYDDLVLDIGPAHGEYNKKLAPSPVSSDDEDLGENPHLKPYHYQDNPDD